MTADKGTAIVLTEARGQVMHLRDDANVNLLQSAHLAKRLVAAGYRVRIRLIIDAGQSPEEYSLLGNIAKETRRAYAQRIENAAEPVAERAAVVTEIREQHSTLRLALAPEAQGLGINGQVLYSPMFAQVQGANEALFARVRKRFHPMLDGAAVDHLLEQIQQYVGRGYLALEEGIARHCLRRELGGLADSVPIDPVLPWSVDPASWLADPLVWSVLMEAFGQHQTGKRRGDFASRLIGLFPSVSLGDGQGWYFNSPTCTRYEHKKIRILARDREGIFAMSGSERVRFDQMRYWLEQQRGGQPERLIGIKYPYLAAILAETIAAEARTAQLAGPVKVAFVEGYRGMENSLTGAMVHTELQARLPEQVAYHRFRARRNAWRFIPGCPGGLPMIQKRLRAFIPWLMDPNPDSVFLFT